MAHAGDRRRRRGPGRADRRRGPDEDRAPLADDVPPALLARQRHRPRHGDERHRHRALGHPRQGARRPVPQALGRAGARPRAPLRPSRRGEDGGLLREQRAAAVRRARGRHGREGLHRVQVDGGAADDAARGPRARAPCRALRRRDAGCRRRRHRHHGRLPRPAEPAHGAPVRRRARAVRPLLVRGAVLAGARRRHRRDPAGRTHADRDGRAPRRRGAVQRAPRRRAPAA